MPDGLSLPSGSTIFGHRAPRYALGYPRQHLLLFDGESSAEETSEMHESTRDARVFFGDAWRITRPTSVLGHDDSQRTIRGRALFGGGACITIGASRGGALHLVEAIAHGADEVCR